MNIALIRESFEAIKPHALEVVEHFYTELFSRYPQAKGLFNEARMAKQHRALVNSLAHIVEFIEDGAHLTDYLRKMGQRHNKYGTQPEHFSWVSEALLATLAYYLDAQWTPELAASWHEAVEFIGKEMLVGMQTEPQKTVEKKPEPPQPSLIELVQNVAQELFKKAIEDEVASENFKREVRNKAQELLQKAIGAEAMQLLSDARSKTRTA